MTGLNVVRLGSGPEEQTANRRKVSKLHFTASQHAWSHQSLLGVNIGYGAAHSPALAVELVHFCV